MRGSLLGLRGRMLLLILSAFAVIIALLVRHTISLGAEKINNASIQLLYEARLVAAEQQVMVKQANVILNDLMNNEGLTPGIPPETCREIFVKFADLTRKFKQVAMAQPNGDIVCTSTPVSGPVNVADRPWFQQMLKSDEMVASNRLTSRVDGSEVILFAKAKRDAGKKTSVVFSLALDLSWLHQQLAEHEHSGGTRLMVLDGRGKVVACHPEKDDLTCKSAALQPLFQAILASGGTGIIDRLELYGTPHVAAFTPLLDTVSGPMFLALTMPELELLAPIKRELAVSLSIATALLVLLMIMVYWGGEKLLVRPLRALSLAVDRFGTGDHAARTGLRHGNDEVGRLSKAFDDMAEAVQSSEQNLARAVRALKTLSGVNNVLIRISNESQLLHDACQIILKKGGYSMAWVGYANDTPEKTITPMAWGGIEDDYQLKLTWADTGHGRGPVGRAIRSGEVQIAHDVRNNPDFAPWRELAEKHGYLSIFSYPLKVAGQVIGVLCIFAAETDAFDEKEIALLTELGSDLAFGIETIRARIEHKKAEEDIHRLAFYDSLTGLPNRRLLKDRLHEALAASMHSGQYGAVLFLGLDHFKKINDTQDHAMGDLLLVEVARRLQTCVREGDSVARMGGDEFAVVLEDLSDQLDEAATRTEMVAEKIRTELGQPCALKDYECHIAASIGICLFGGHLESVGDMLKHVDVAMYQAKMAGRNTIRFFDPQMLVVLNKRVSIEADLRHALDKQQFRLHYQIQVDSQGKATGAEVLLRWEHPERGLVFPDQFIPLAEETGLILPIGLWVLQTACDRLKAWQQDALTRDLVLAVNVSARQFHQADFVTQVQQVLLECGAQPSQLKLELTESTVLEDIQDTIAKMHEIKQLGVDFSMDDFGTGYSSLQYLKRLPLDQVKIDRSFISDITSDPDDAAIVQAIIAMTDALGLNVIAEGVETKEQRDFLDKHGCHAFQGYLFSKPVPIEQFEALLKQG